MPKKRTLKRPKRPTKAGSATAVDEARALRDTEELSNKIIDTVREGLLVLDSDLRVLRANQSFYDRFAVNPDKTEGRLIYELGNGQWDIPELRRLLENVLPNNNVFNDYVVEHEFETIGLRVMLLNGRRVDSIQHILLAIEDVTEWHRADQTLRESERHFRTIFDSAAVGMAQVAPKGRLRRTNAAFRHMLGYEENELQQLTYCDITHADDLATTEVQLERLRAGHADTFSMEQRNIRKDGSTCWVHLTVSTVRNRSGRLRYFVSAHQDIDRRKGAEAELKRLNESLEQQIAERIEMLSILQDVTRSANEARTAEEAMYAALERIAQYNGWHVGHVWRQADDRSGQMVDSGIWYTTDKAEKAIGRLDEFQQIFRRHRFSPGEGMIGAVMQPAQPKWVDDIKHFDDWQRADAEHFGLHAAIAFPVTVNGEVVAVLEFFSDHPTRRERRFMEIMPDVGIQLGHVIERKRLEREIAVATATQQRDFGRELHDSVSQELTGLRLMSEKLRERLARKSSPLVDEAGIIAGHLQKVHEQVRRLSRGLMPVDVDAEGLRAALEELVQDSGELYNVACEFHSSAAVRVEDNETATHMYRIAQEAIQNAVKHGPPGHIVVHLLTEDHDIVMQIEDDGAGFEQTRQWSAGTGHRIMQHRAGLIGASLGIESQQGKGTTVTCTLPKEAGHGSQRQATAKSSAPRAAT